MSNQNLRLFVYSSLAIVLLTLVWGFRSIPEKSRLGGDLVRASVEQESMLMVSSTRAAVNALKYRLLDILKAEGNDLPTRTFRNSHFVAASLIEWDQANWRIAWVSSKMKEQFHQDALAEWIRKWPLARLGPGEVHIAKVGDIDGTAYFAVIAPVRKPNNQPLFGVGVFPATQFGLEFSAGRLRRAFVVDGEGAAVALNSPAYLGTSMKRETLVEEILRGEDVTARHERRDALGRAFYSVAARVPGTNLFAIVESEPVTYSLWVAWLYLLLGATGAIALNWAVFGFLTRPLFKQLRQIEDLNEKLKRQAAEAPVAPPAPPLIHEPRLPDVDFVEADEAATGASVTPRLTQVVRAALRSLEPRLKESGIQVHQNGMDLIDVEGDALQLQTAIEEVLKNAIEAMQGARRRELTITAIRHDGRARLTIADTGCGIPADDLGRVFDPFFSTKDSEGVARGLGLNVVRRVLEEMKGEVRLAPNGDQGVSVELDWPIERPAVEAVPEALELELVPEPETESADEFVSFEPRRELPGIAIRKPIVRTLD